MAVTGQLLLLLNLVILRVNYSNHSPNPADVPLRVSVSSVTGICNSSFRSSFAGLSLNDRSTANFKFKSRAKRFLSCRVQYTAKGTSSFHLERVLLACGDVSVNPGPRKLKTAPKYPCNECQRAVRNNQDAILCSGCNKWSHAKCLHMSRTTFRYYLDKPDLEWTCATCTLPPLSDSFFAEDSIEEPLFTNVDLEVIHSNQRFQERSNDIITDNAQLESQRKYASKDILMCHLNINSIQNKFEVLAATIKKIGAHIAFISETKIDASYPDAQF